jgi:hypothetical protein
VDYAKDDGGTWRGITTMDATRFQYERPTALVEASELEPAITRVG